MVDSACNLIVHPIDEANACLLYDFDSKKVVKKFGLPEVVTYGITDRMTLLVTGNEKSYRLIEKTDDGSSKQLQEFNVIEPVKKKPRRR